MSNTGRVEFLRSEYYDTSLTLLDYFAGQTLSGWLSTFREDVPQPKQIAKLVYDIAEAMVVEKLKREQ